MSHVILIYIYSDLYYAMWACGEPLLVTTRSFMNVFSIRQLGISVDFQTVAFRVIILHLHLLAVKPL